MADTDHKLLRSRRVNLDGGGNSPVSSALFWPPQLSRRLARVVTSSILWRDTTSPSSLRRLGTPSSSSCLARASGVLSILARAHRFLLPVRAKLTPAASTSSSPQVTKLALGLLADGRRAEDRLEAGTWSDGNTRAGRCMGDGVRR